MRENAEFADNSNRMNLRFGIEYKDLYEREGLERIDRAFLGFVAEAVPGAATAEEKGPK